MKNFRFRLIITLLSMALLLTADLFAQGRTSSRKEQKNSVKRSKPTVVIAPQRVSSPVVIKNTVRTNTRPIIRTQVAPPIMRVEVIPAKPSYRSIWIPGYWIFDIGLNRHVWVTGYCNAYPLGASWTSGYWTYSNGYYSWSDGYWIYR